MSFRFVHTADIHLDSPLRSLALRDPALAELVGNASRLSFAAIIDLCLDEAVDALLIAGDLYDGDQTSMKTALFLAGELRRLDAAGIPTFMIRGNHDALSRITRELALPESVKLFGGRAEAVTLERGPGARPVVIHGLSFAQPHAPDALLPRYLSPAPGAINIGMMHTSLDGAPGHDRYAPCASAALLASGFDYWALGHIHQRSVIAGPCRVVMPGIPQGRDIGEAGAKSASLVEIGDDRTIRIEERSTAVAQFERIVLDLAGIAEWRALLGAGAAALRARRAAVTTGHLIVGVVLTGATPLAWRLHRDEDQLEAEFRSLAAELPTCWIDGVDAAAVVTPSLTSQSGTAESAIAELQRLIATDILPGAACQRALAGLADELRGHLPPECRHMLGADAEEAAQVLAAFARDGVAAVLARLQPTADGEGA